MNEYGVVGVNEYGAVGVNEYGAAQDAAAIGDGPASGPTAQLKLFPAPSSPVCCRICCT